MNAIVDQRIAEEGSARVLVSLSTTSASASKKAGRDISKYFAPVKKWQKESEPGYLDSLPVVENRSSGATPPDEALSPTAPTQKLRVFPLLGLAIGVVTRAGADGLAASAAVSDMVPVEELRLIRPVAAELAAVSPEVSWGLQRLEVPALWNQGHFGQGVIVGHVDTGIDGTHPSLAGAIHRFARAELNGDIVEDVAAVDSGDHGTHTAGTIAGRTTAFGTFGVAPQATLASAMVIEGGDVITRIIAGIEWAIAQGSVILSASLGLPGTSPVFRALINGIRANGVLPVIAVGNEGVTRTRYPGNYDTVLSVGAVDDSDAVAWFSGSQAFGPPNRRTVPHLCGPGVAVVSCIPGGQLAKMDGTSMATPHIAGLAALLKSAEPNADMADIETAILGSCTLPGSWPVGRGGKGIPNGVRALELLRG
ncbi:MAG: S8 family serine peptidase [Sphingopyxis sp.]|nr:S8 family serine peptidase [Sphingopyxis sp.]